MKIVTWNVNGIRSLKKNINVVLAELDSDINCFQETKIIRCQLPENIALIDGYTSYYSYPRKQSGYSGVATYCKDKFCPEDAEEGLSGVLQGKKDESLLQLLNESQELPFDLVDLDSEGRIIITDHLTCFEDEIRHLSIINVYCPRVDPEKPERHLYKMQFCHMLEAKTKKLIEDGCFVMIVGDLNISCSVMDHCDPGDENEFNSSEARQWLKRFLSSKIGYFNGDIHMVDAFRYLYPDRANAFTCWNTKIGARQTNFGTRIDYIIVTSNLLPFLLKCDILPEYEGSDHCPVYAEFKCRPTSKVNAKLPSICTRLWPEFSGKQQSLKSFLKKTQDLADSLIKTPEPKKNVARVPESSQSLMKPLEPHRTVLKNDNTDKNKQKSITSFFKAPVKVQDVAMDNEICVNFITESDCSIKEEITNCSQNSTDSSSCVELSCVDGVISSSQKNSQVAEWKLMLKGPPKPPLCSGHKKLSVLRTVKKKGPNFGRQFFMCSMPTGHASNSEANCNFFKWVTAAKINSLKK